MRSCFSAKREQTTYKKTAQPVPGAELIGPRRRCSSSLESPNPAQEARTPKGNLASARGSDTVAAGGEHRYSTGPVKVLKAWF